MLGIFWVMPLYTAGKQRDISVFNCFMLYGIVMCRVKTVGFELYVAFLFCVALNVALTRFRRGKKSTIGL